MTHLSYASDRTFHMQRPRMHERNGRQSNPACVALLGLCHRRGRVGRRTLLRWDALRRVCIGSLSPVALLQFAPRRTRSYRWSSTDSSRAGACERERVYRGKHACRQCSRRSLLQLAAVYLYLISSLREECRGGYRGKPPLPSSSVCACSPVSSIWSFLCLRVSPRFVTDAGGLRRPGSSSSFILWRGVYRGKPIPCLLRSEGGRMRDGLSGRAAARSIEARD